MKKTSRIWLTVLAGAALSIGCTARERAESHEKAAPAEARREIPIEKQPVAGHDVDERPIARDTAPSFMDEVRSKLGDGWTVEPRENGLIATRNQPGKRAADFRKKLIEDKKSLIDDQHGASATFMNGEIKLSGSFDHCRNAAKWVDKYADLEGVNKIVLDASCPND
jgi:hypothetical protein